MDFPEFYTGYCSHSFLCVNTTKNLLFNIETLTIYTANNNSSYKTELNTTLAENKLNDMLSLTYYTFFLNLLSKLHLL